MLFPPLRGGEGGTTDILPPLFIKGIIPLELYSASRRFFETAIKARAFCGEGAEEPAGRQAGVFGNPVELFAGGKTPPEFPGIDGAHGDAQIGGDVFQGEASLPPPRPEGGGKVVADVAPESHFPGHGKISAQARGRGKRKNSAREIFASSRDKSSSVPFTLNPQLSTITNAACGFWFQLKSKKSRIAKLHPDNRHVRHT